MTHHEQEGAGRSRVNFTGRSLKEFLHREESKENILYYEVVRHSREYQEVLGLTEKDMERMEKLQENSDMYPDSQDWYRGALVQIQIGDKKFKLVSKETCCAPYRESQKEKPWERLLMAVSNDDSLNRQAGRGTVLIMGVNEHWHKEIIEAIKRSANTDDLPGELFGFFGKK